MSLRNIFSELESVVGCLLLTPSVQNNVSRVSLDMAPLTLPHLQLSASSIKINGNHSLVPRQRKIIERENVMTQVFHCFWSFMHKMFLNTTNKANFTRSKNPGVLM